MKKKIAYYLEDNSRLKEISADELKQWVEEMPYSQPLRLLSKIKSSQLGESTAGTGTYGAYFAEDYEPFVVKVKGKESQSEKSKEEVASSEMSESTSTKIASLTVAAAMPSIKTEEVGENEIEEPVEISHDLADDFGEGTLEEDLLEVNPNTVLVNEINHLAADESLEDQIELEVQERFINEVDVVTSFSELYEAAEEPLREVIKGNVDYSSFASNLVETKVGVIEDIDFSDELEFLPTEDSELPEVLKETIQPLDGDLNVEHIIDAESLDLEDEVKILEKVKSKKNKKSKSSKKKKKAKAKVIAKKDKPREDSKIKKKKSKQEALKKKDKNKEKKSKAKSTIDSKVSKNEKTIKSKKAVVKNVKGELKVSRPSKTISIKGEKRQKVERSPSSDKKNKKAKSKSSVKYVIVNESVSADFKLKDYEGVSSYTNWLLEQESINGKKELEPMSKKKKKAKKKKSKSKVPKAASDSLKKRSTIISEPLANILAMQGHKKKAAKMYKQLGLIFPEKSSYFAAKIQTLKNK